jgi:hypothetical protein
MKKIVTILCTVVLLSSLGLAHGEETFAHAEELIDAKVDCDTLTDDDLEKIGDYYMEQMHPGEAHEAMDAMMGGEGSEQLRKIHINMARSFYCGDHSMMEAGMMNMMMGRSGMMDSITNTKTVGGNKMMNGFGMGSTIGMSFLWLINLAVGAFIVGVIFWWTKKLVGGK